MDDTKDGLRQTPEEGKMIALNNAGVYLYMAGVRILLDALEDGYPPYAPSDENVFSLPAEVLLFTHKHPDHFSARMTAEYLRRYPACRVYAGEEVIESLSGVPLHRLVTLYPYKKEKLSEELTLTPWPARHMGPEYRHKQHYALRLEYGARRVLFTGDAAPIHNSFEHGEERIGQVDFMVAPYVYALYAPAQRLFGKSVETKVLAVNHIPEPDTEGIRARLQSIPASDRAYRLIICKTNTEVRI